MKQLKFCFINVITGTGFKLDFKQEAKKKISHLIKDSRKAKSMLREKTVFLQKYIRVYLEKVHNLLYRNKNIKKESNRDT